MGLSAWICVHLCALLYMCFYPASLALVAWCLYAVALGVYHCCEFFVTARWNPVKTSADSFLVNQSQGKLVYVIASV